MGGHAWTSDRFDGAELSRLSELICADLKRVNQDFREVSKLFAQSSILLEFTIVSPDRLRTRISA